MSSDKLKKLKKGVGKWTAFYRENPHRLAVDYLGMKWLKPFQQALIVMVRPEGFEPPTFRIGICCDIQLRHGRIHNYFNSNYFDFQ